MIDDSLNDVQPDTITIHCTIRCEDGKAPPEDVVDAMLNCLQVYAEAKYPKLVKVNEYQYWEISLKDYFNFALYWSLK